MEAIIVMGVGLCLVLVGIALGGKRESKQGNAALIAKQYKGMSHVDYPVLPHTVERGSNKGTRRGSTYRRQ